ncbi:response regulator transcription factor [Dactylosporangium sp. CA-052675]|uniref:response regulator transcription factor n=1 Tax=Dactylosporangium sp. CA-052675 TaxID=3239927 RepID=UPI003D8FE078
MTNRLVLADDSVLLRVGLERLLAAEGFDVVGSAGDAEELRRLVARERPDAVIVDIRMPPSFTDEGLRAALRLRREEPGLAILLLSQYIETRDVVTILEQGEAGVGYLLKDRITDIDRFLADVRRVLAGGTAIDPLVVERVMRRPRRRDDEGLGALSDREREILALMAEGLSNVAVSERLFLAERTVEAHIRSIFVKLGLPALPDTNRRVLAVLTHLRT